MTGNVTKTFLTGATIFNQGDPADCAYLIESGQVQISIVNDHEEIPVAVLGPGDIFGEMAVIDGLPRSASAACLSTVLVSAISRTQFKQRIEAMDPLARLLLGVLIKRVRGANLHQLGLVEENYGSSNELKKDKDSSLVKTGLEAVQRIKLELELQAALKNSEFKLFYQPIVELRTSRLLGFEALLRWESPTRGKVRTDLFVDVAEESSLIIPIGAWVLERAMLDLQTLKLGTGRDDLYMSINVSARQFADPNFIHDLEAIRSRVDVLASDIKLEVTERVFVQSSMVPETLDQCRQLGYKIALDDFGTGYSSLAYIAKMNVDTIKIDRSFVSEIGSKPKVQAIVTAIITLTKALGLETTAEGIENREEQFMLSGMGCPSGQGYLFSRPEPIDVLLAQLPTEKAA